MFEIVIPHKKVLLCEIFHPSVYYLWILYHKFSGQKSTIAGMAQQKVLAFFVNYDTMLSHLRGSGQKLLLGACKQLRYLREVIIPYPQIPQEFVGGFTRRSSALAEPDNDKINTMSNHLGFGKPHLCGRRFSVKTFVDCVYYTIMDERKIKEISTEYLFANNSFII